MRYTTEKIMLSILLFEIVMAIFIAFFYNDLYQATIDGRSKIGEYGQVINTPAQSWSVTLKNNLTEFFNNEA